MAEKRSGYRRYDSRRDPFATWEDDERPAAPAANGTADGTFPRCTRLRPSMRPAERPQHVFSAAWRDLAAASAARPDAVQACTPAVAGAAGGTGLASGSNRPPWHETGQGEVQHHHAHGGKAKNAEITPVEVLPSSAPAPLGMSAASARLLQGMRSFQEDIRLPMCRWIRA